MSRHLLVITTAIVLAACAANGAFQEGKLLIEQGQVEEGLRQLEKASKEEPGNPEIRAYYMRSRDTHINQLVLEADRQRLVGRSENAEALYKRVLAFDAENQRAKAGLAATEAEGRHRRIVAEAKKLFDGGDFGGAEARLRPVLTENPSQREAKALARSIDERRVRAVAVPRALQSALRKPVTLEFRNTPLRNVFEVLSRTAGINFVFDREVRPDLTATIFVRDTKIEDVVRFLLVTNQLQQKVFTENTILIYPNLPHKVRDYQELAVKSFYLGNADVKQTLNLIRTVLRTRDVFVDERTNLLVMRDTPEAIRLAEKLIAAQDVVDPEVMLEVEVLEVNRNRLQELGIRWPDQIGYGLLQGGATTTTIDPTGRAVTATTPGTSVASGVIDLHNRSGLTTFVLNPLLLLNLKAQDSFANVLANPRIRVKNRDKARIHIGDKLPVVSTTAAAVGAFVSENVTYLDVGLKLEVEPSVHPDDEVEMKVGLEVSSAGAPTTTRGGGTVYQVNTRNAATTLRLKTGETQMLAGLIQQEERKTAAKVPGLGDLPIVGRLFSSQEDRNNRTEVVLLITPYVVRNVERPGAAVLEFAAGTEGATGGPAVGVPTVVPPPARPVVPTPKPAPAPKPAPKPSATPSAPSPLQPFLPAPKPGQ